MGKVSREAELALHYTVRNDGEATLGTHAFNTAKALAEVYGEQRHSNMVSVPRDLLANAVWTLLNAQRLIDEARSATVPEVTRLRSKREG